jgi:hypothetical protein
MAFDWEVWAGFKAKIHIGKQKGSTLIRLAPPSLFTCYGAKESELHTQQESHSLHWA